MTRGSYMKWTQEANEALSKVPFFVRKLVRKRIEEETTRVGAALVRPEHVQAAKERFLNRMEDEVTGYQVETCFGPTGCPNRAIICEGLPRALEETVACRDLRSFLKKRVQGELKMHHEFRISLSDCPNACSRPQIADIGIIGARKPAATSEECSLCGACTAACREEAISFPGDAPVLDYSRCVFCGKCIGACPTGAIAQDAAGYRILVGGKLGRHPQLAMKLPGIHPEEDVIRIVNRCLDHYQRHCTEGERFGEILEKTGIGALLEDVQTPTGTANCRLSGRVSTRPVR